MTTVSSLEVLVGEQLREAHIPGAALAVVAGEEVVYARGFGRTSAEDGGSPVRPETVFRVGSISKTLTAAAIMRLVEADKLGLDEPVRTYVPDFTLRDRGAADRVTLRMLLSHTAGLADDYQPSGSRDAAGLERYVRERVPTLPIVAPPGALYSYSSAGTNVAGHVAERAAGAYFQELMHSWLFEPLAMPRTTFGPLVACTYPLAQGHRLRDGEVRVDHHFPDNTAGYPSAYACSTVLDLARFAIAQLNGGTLSGQSVLSAASVVEMQRPHADCFTPSGLRHALGFEVGRYKGGHVFVGHDGGVGGYTSRLWLLPGAGLAVILACNRAADAWPAAVKIANSALDAFLAPPARRETGFLARESGPPPDDSSAPPPVDRAQVVGAYLGLARGLVAVRAQGEGLVLQWHGEEIPLRPDPVRDDLYTGRGANLGIPDTTGGPSDGPVPYIMLNSSPCERTELVAPDGHSADAPDPTRYVGRYDCDIADTLTFRTEEGTLFMHSRQHGMEVRCTPVGGHRFACRVGVLEFTAEEDAASAVVVGGTLHFQRT